MLNKVERKIKRSGVTQKVRPVFKWGQSKRSVYLHVKYSHRFDAPGCLDIYNQKVEMLKEGLGSGEDEAQVSMGGMELVKFEGELKGEEGGQFLRFEAVCEIAGQPSRFVLELELFEPVLSWSITKGKLCFLLV